MDVVLVLVFIIMIGAAYKAPSIIRKIKENQFREYEDE